MSMEFTLHCNLLECRAPLQEKGVVTSCSHIFCVNCFESSKDSRSESQRRCPACHASLSARDDAILTALRPLDDSKMSVLSGLSPDVIMECAGRAMSFWAYQASQEVLLEQYMSKSWAQKHDDMKIEMDSMMKKRSVDVENRDAKLSNLKRENEELQRKMNDLSEAYQEKSRKHAQTQRLYDSLKKRSLSGQDDRPETVCPSPRVPSARRHAPYPALPTYMRHDTRRVEPKSGTSHGFASAMGPPLQQYRETGLRSSHFDKTSDKTRSTALKNSFRSPSRHPVPMEPPQRLSLPFNRASNISPSRNSRNSSIMTPNPNGSSSPQRQYLTAVDPNANSAKGGRLSSLGISAGIKMGR